MRTDLRTMFWKERVSLLSGRSRRQILIVGGVLGLEALIFPIQMGHEWASDPVMLALVGIIMPLIIVGVIVPDAIAGERERHTLATLLASRLPDRAILFGKLGFGIVVGWLAAPVMLTVTLVVANAVGGWRELVLYDPVAIGTVLIAGLLVAVLTGTVGMFISLRASTAQEAQQLTVTAFMLPVFLVAAVLMIVGGDPNLRRQVLESLAAADWQLIGAALLGALALVDLILLWAADRRFRRGRLLAM